MEDVVKASDDLMDTLHRAQILTHKLLEFSKAKEAALKSDDVGGLNELLVGEEDLVAAVHENEKEREFRSDALAAAVGVKKENTRLREIINLVAYPSCRTKLEQARNELMEELARLTQQNAKVKEILQYKVNYTDFMLNLLYVPQKKVFSYNVQGDKEDGFGSQNLLDYRA